MNHYFRWQGLAGFFATLTALAAILWVLAPSIVKLSIEQGGSWYFGAQVNVESVEIDYTPFKVDVSELAVTDNSKPSHNLFSFEHASASVDVWQYVFGRVVIDDLNITGLAFDSQRASAGEVYRDSNTSIAQHTGQSLKRQLPAVEQSLPNVKDILNDSDLLSIKASKQLQQLYHDEKQKLLALESQLPDDERLKAYEVKVKKLVDSKVKSLDDVAKVKAELDQLKSQFKQDKKLIKQAKNQLTQSKDVIAQAVKDAQQAPEKDWQYLQTKYQLDKIDNADFAHILFGEQAREYYQTAETIYYKLAPYLQQKSQQSAEQKAQQQQSLAAGRFVHFNDNNLLPDWLIKNAEFSLKLPQGTFQFSLQEVTAQHWIRNKPTLMTVATSDLLKGGSGQLQANIFNHPDSYKVDGDYLFEQVPVTNAKLREQDSFALSLDTANIAGVGQFAIEPQGVVNVNEFKLVDAHYSGHADSSIGQALLASVSDIDNFDLSVELSGDISAPDMRVASDLDGIIGQAVNKQLQAQLNRFQTDLQTGLNDKVASALNSSQTDAAQIADMELLLTDTDQALDKLLKANVTDNKKKELEDKLKKKLGKLFG
ncbi:TIGR03545 family protein [Thalassotalea sp. HSM 43]|uniref:TIGR03545 family protein n=1 Tax=Thalassotalea sp. HSM 43 TaxID=2552945 RepID=UPI001081DD4B|nr:TIGR03545 family protein [Thalassotalea sp. HSM 43]QBY03602.1 TIGR03545 family protein [Thalassotalea sp. HSM 43]